MAVENQTNFHQDTSGFFSLKLSQTSAHELVLLLEFQRGLSVSPRVISGSLLYIATKSLELALGQNQSFSSK
jgi:hypothetical protein